MLGMKEQYNVEISGYQISVERSKINTNGGQDGKVGISALLAG